MAIAIYNPKFFGGVPNKADIKGFVWSHARWDLKINELKKFPEEVGKALLRHFGFLVEVTDKNLTEIENQMLEKQFQCKECPFGTNTKIAFVSHVQKKHMTNKDDSLKGIEEAQPTGTVGAVVSSPTAESGAGVPSTEDGPVTDADGVQWVGEGLQEDTIK